MFEDVITLFDDYYRALDQADEPAFQRDLAMEVHDKLEQLDYIVGRVRACEEALTQALERHRRVFAEHVERVHREGLDYESVAVPAEVQMTRAEIDKMNAAQFELELMTEAFYYFAARVRFIAKHGSHPLPGLHKFECVGVRDVRNKLLEHPEGKDSGVFIRSFGAGGEHGPVLKAARYGGQEDVYPDAGLYANAEEFKTNLTKSLERAVQEGLAQQDQTP